MTKWLNESHTTSKHQSDSCDCPAATSIPFLDTSCSIVNGVIKTDLYKKETDRNQYLLTSSCHPAHVTSNIPFSLALRIVRICSDPEDREQRFSELRSMLLARDYKSKIIDSCIEKARQIPRQEALNKVVRDKNNPDRMVFVIHYDPRLPSVPASPTATTAPWSRTPTWRRSSLPRPWSATEDSVIYATTLFAPKFRRPPLPGRNEHCLGWRNVENASIVLTSRLAVLLNLLLQPTNLN